MRPIPVGATPRLRWLCYISHMPTFRHENRLGRKTGAVICGVDEAGRGPLAGPVVACAAILPVEGISTRLLGALDDSKRLSAEVREEVAVKLRPKIVWCLGMASVEEIDRFNILRATFMAMRRAVEGLSVQSGSSPPTRSSTAIKNLDCRARKPHSLKATIFPIRSRRHRFSRKSRVTR